jgi:hypothetical protein
MSNLSKCALQQNSVVAPDWLKPLFLFLTIIFLLPLTLIAGQQKIASSIFCCPA